MRRTCICQPMMAFILNATSVSGNRQIPVKAEVSHFVAEHGVFIAHHQIGTERPLVAPTSKTTVTATSVSARPFHAEAQHERSINDKSDPSWPHVPQSLLTIVPHSLSNLAEFFVPNHLGEGPGQYIFATIVGITLVLLSFCVFCHSDDTEKSCVSQRAQKQEKKRSALQDPGLLAPSESSSKSVDHDAEVSSSASDSQFAVDADADAEVSALPVDPAVPAGDSESKGLSLGFEEVFTIVGNDGPRCFRWILQSDASKFRLPSPRKVKPSLQRARTCAKRDLSGDADPNDYDVIDAPMNPDVVAQTLQKHGISTKSWEEGRLNELATEVTNGSAALLVNANGHLRRAIHVIMLVIRSPWSGEVVVADEDSIMYRQSMRASKLTGKTTSAENKQKTPCVAWNPKQSIQEVVESCLTEQLAMPTYAFELCRNVKFLDEEEFSERFPGLTTIVRKRIVQCYLATEDPQLLKQINVNPASRSSSLTKFEKNNRCFQVRTDDETYHWRWNELESVPELAKHRAWLNDIDTYTQSKPVSMPAWEKARKMAKVAGKLGAVMQVGKLARIKETESTSIQAMTRRPSMEGKHDTKDDTVLLPWTKKDITELLADNNTTAETFGMSLEELSSQASQGLLYFGLRSNGELIVIRDTVRLQIFSPQGQAVLVEVKKDQDKSAEDNQLDWPSSTKRLDESAWEVARRIVQGHLNVKEGIAHVSFKAENFPLESGSVVNHRMMLSVQIPEGMENRCSSIHAAKLTA